MNKKLSTDSYKGVRDFYPDDMAVQRYIFDTWARTAESFGYERYDASVLEPSDLYKSKGAENEEMVNEQTYTFTDRGNREVTLRPEMTPTVARMIAGKKRELSFPVRWYSIPNLFRYERMQRGRLREHWQLNCDIFGADDISADIEIIALAHQIFVNFGADENMFEIRVNNRELMHEFFKEHGIGKSEAVSALTRIIDRKDKMSPEDFRLQVEGLMPSAKVSAFIEALEQTNEKFLDSDGQITDLKKVINGLNELGIKNISFSPFLARGFDYYTGTIFEIFDKNPENNRSMMGGGRYDNLTEMFGGDAVPGVGFGFGDVTLRNFLESNDLLTSNLTSPSLMIIPTESSLNIEGQKIAKQFRDAGLSVATDMSAKKVGKKISSAGDAFVEFALVLGEDEINTKTYVVKNLTDKTEQTGSIDELITALKG